MFIAFEQKEPESTGVLAGIRNMFARPEISLTPRRAMGIQYMLLEADIGRRGFSWDMVIKACGRYAGRLLLPPDIEAPVFYARPSFPNFESAVLLATACEIIERSGCPMYRRVAGLIDTEARHTSMLEELLKYYTCVKVFTNHPERYLPEIERMMREFGAPVIFASDLSSLNDCVLILSPCAMPLPSSPAKLAAPLLALSGPPESIRCTDLFTNPKVTLSAELLRDMPGGLDPHEFAGALYEFCGAREMCLVADKMLYNHRYSTLTEAAHVVEASMRLRIW